MCLGVPMKIVKVEDEHFVIAEIEGSQLRVNCSLLENPVCGEYIIVHAGFGIQKLDADEAAQTLALLAKIGEAEQ